MTTRNDDFDLGKAYSQLADMMEDRTKFVEQFFRYAKAERHPESDEEKKLERIFFEM